MERQEISYFVFLNHLGKLITSESVQKSARYFPVLDVLMAGINSELRSIYDVQGA